MRCRRYTRTPAQHHLVAHEFTVVFSLCAGGRMIARISGVGARGPLPGIAEDLLKAGLSLSRSLAPGGNRMEVFPFQQVTQSLCRIPDGAGRDLPFELGWKPRA